MAYIKVIQEEEATGELKEVYGKYAAKYGMAPEIRKVLSIKPGFVRTYDEWVRQITFGGSSLGRRREELISLIGSSQNKSTH